MDDNKLGKEYEDWLDSVELQLPLIVPEGEDHGKNQNSTADLLETSKS